MLDQVKKVLLAGLGVAFYTREKVEEIVKNLIQSDQLTREQGAKILDDLAEKGKTGQEEFVAKINEEISAILAKWQPVQKSEFDDLLARVEAVEKHIGLSRNRTEEG